eukprot:11176862-Lingulodinium_polyedra.AAC.1
MARPWSRTGVSPSPAQRRDPAVGARRFGLREDVRAPRVTPFCGAGQSPARAPPDPAAAPRACFCLPAG